MASGEARLRIFEALIKTYRRAGVPVLVWVPPLNIEQLRDLGLSVEGLNETVTVLRHLAEANGASLIDLHALLPDAAFLDSSDHFTVAGKPNGTAIVGVALARALAKFALPLTPSDPKPPDLPSSPAVQ